MASDLIQVSNAPAIPGLTFRHFRGPSDFPGMVAVVNASADADKVEYAPSVESAAHIYAHLINCDAYRDMVFTEINGEVVGYWRCWGDCGADDGPYLYPFMGYLVPAWRRKGLGQIILRWLEGRLHEIAAGHPVDRPKFLQASADQYQTGVVAMLEREGYRPTRYSFDMVRPTLEGIPDFAVPAGLEIRPVLPEHHRAIWDASNEACRDNWGFSPPTEEEYQAWLTSKTVFQPHLWQVAWDVATNQVAGQVRTFIDHAQNEKYSRRRGLTEFVSVRRPWRRRGLARALIARSLYAQKEQGMTESALGVDSENLSGATRVYEDCGFRVVRRSTVYRKPL
jgi:mycothiol synthase